MSRHFWSFCRLVLFLSVCLPQTSHPCGHTVCAFAFWSFFFWVDWKLPEGRCKLLITLLIQIFLFSSVLICVVQRRISKRLHFLTLYDLKELFSGSLWFELKPAVGNLCLSRLAVRVITPAVWHHQAPLCYPIICSVATVAPVKQSLLAAVKASLLEADEKTLVYCEILSNWSNSPALERFNICWEDQYRCHIYSVNVKLPPPAVSNLA